MARFRATGSREESDWLTLGQAARFLGVAQSTIRKWSDHGRIPTFYTPGGHRRYKLHDLETFVDRSGPGRRTSGPVVLVVDDDERVRELVRAALEVEGYVVREAGGADEGMRAIEAETPDLVLLDVMMPHVDGWEMLRRIQEGHGPGALPVVMFSGQADEEVESEAASRGARGFVGKPFDLRRLVEQAAQAIAKN